MSAPTSKPSIARRTIGGFLNYIERAYRYSRLRNKLLAIKSQNKTKLIASSSKRFVIFLVPGQNIVNGGIISICSIASATKNLLAKHGVSVAVCTGYGEPRMSRFTKFENDIDIVAFSDLLPLFPNGADVLVHVPEIFAQRFVADCLFVFQARSDLIWRFNILLQNIDLIPPKESVDLLREVGPTTATINHRASAEIARRLDCPIHYLSWGLCAEDFERVRYSKKKKLVVISPDPHSAKSEIVRQISETLPDHKLVEIRNMTYEKYKSIVRRAKFTFTFGEGLDGYFVESIFSGGVAMAIFSERFFTNEYRNLEGVFADSNDAILHVGDFLKKINNEREHQRVSDTQYAMVARTFVREKHLKYISTYYDTYFRPRAQRLT